MKRFIISFNDGDMKFPVEELPQVSIDSHAVVDQAKAAEVWIFGGGFFSDTPIVVTESGEISEGPLQKSDVRLGGFSVIDVETIEDAQYWAKEIARSCRCPQEIREMIYDTEATN